MVETLHYVTLPVADVTRAVRFYVDLLGLDDLGDDTEPGRDETVEYHWLDANGTAIRLAFEPERTPDGSDLDPAPRLAFTATEVERTDLAARLNDEGIDAEQTTTGLFFRDPDGNRLAVVEPGRVPDRGARREPDRS